MRKFYKQIDDVGTSELFLIFEEFEDGNDLWFAEASSEENSDLIIAALNFYAQNGLQ